MRRVLSSCSLSLEAVKHGHTISAVGVEPCTGRLYFSGGEGGRGERVTRAYTVEVQTASVFYAQSLILLSLMAVKYGHTR